MFSLANNGEKLLLDEQLLETAVTPKGYLYPTKMRLGENGTTDFFLTFTTHFDASVFDPKNKHAAPSP
jgi:hypothetical protein